MGFWRGGKEGIGAGGGREGRREGGAQGNISGEGTNEAKGKTRRARDAKGCTGETAQKAGRS